MVFAVLIVLLVFTLSMYIAQCAKTVRLRNQLKAFMTKLEWCDHRFPGTQVETRSCPACKALNPLGVDSYHVHTPDCPLATMMGACDA